MNDSSGAATPQEIADRLRKLLEIGANGWVKNPGWMDVVSAIQDAARLLSAVAVGPDATKMRSALEKIERWFGEFPATGETWDDGSTMSYSACYGSNGERDYMRGIAKDALRVSPLTNNAAPQKAAPQHVAEVDQAAQPAGAAPISSSNPQASTPDADERWKEIRHMAWLIATGDGAPSGNESALCWTVERIKQLERELAGANALGVIRIKELEQDRAQLQFALEQSEARFLRPTSASIEPDGYAVLLDDPKGDTPGGCGYWYVGAYRTEVVADSVAERGKSRVVPMYFAPQTLSASAGVEAYEAALDQLCKALDVEIASPSLGTAPPQIKAYADRLRAAEEKANRLTSRLANLAGDA